MKYAYRVWHSEHHRTAQRRREAPALEPSEVLVAHENLEALVMLSYELEPETQVRVALIHPIERGAIVLLEGGLTELDADESIGRCLVRINAIDASLCFIAEPLPGGDSFHQGWRTESDRGDGTGTQGQSLSSQP